MTAILKVSAVPQREAARTALREAGIATVEIEQWGEAAEKLQREDDCLVICDGESAREIGARMAQGTGLTREATRALSHELRTPLSAMAGWIHLIETGKLDEAGTRKAIARLRGNIDDQVRTIERYLGQTTQQGKATTP